MGEKRDHLNCESPFHIAILICTDRQLVCIQKMIGDNVAVHRLERAKMTHLKTRSHAQYAVTPKHAVSLLLGKFELQIHFCVLLVL